MILAAHAPPRLITVVVNLIPSRSFWTFRFPLLLAGSLTLLSACQANHEADVEAIRALVNQEVEAINRKDLKGLSAVWAQSPDILLFDVSPPGRFQGWERIARTFREFFDRFSEIEMSVDEVQVVVEGPIGYATYEWTITGRMGEYPVRDRGKATAIYRREDDVWKLTHAHYSPVPAALALEQEMAEAVEPIEGGEDGDAESPESATGGEADAAESDTAVDVESEAEGDVAD